MSSNFQKLIDSVQSYIDNIAKSKAEKNHEHIGYINKDEIKPVAFSGSYEDLEDKPDMSSSLNIKKFSINSNQWEYDLNNKLFTLTLKHNLNSKDIIVNSRNSSSGYTIVLSSICIDDNTIKIYNDDNPMCNITIISV